jgi:preprotein translocase subunit SecG
MNAEEKTTTAIGFVVLVIIAIVGFVLIAGCAGSGEGGAFTPQDAEAIERATSGFINDINRVRYPDRPVYPPGAPFPVYPTP